MLRYLRALADRDLALDRSMIPLGSCTMKLNATGEMIPMTWPEFGALHPFAPPEQAAGYRRAHRRARADAVRRDRIRGRIAAAQRRLAGRIRGPARDRGVARVPRRGASQRVPDPRVGARHQSGVGADGRACRSSSSPATPAATSTSPTSRRKARRARERSRRDHGHLPVDARRIRGRHRTHLRHRARSWRPGVRRRRQHQCAGRASPRPGEFGADVSHLNLHKTFCIPHGGGGPGVGPVAWARISRRSCPAIGTSVPLARRERGRAKASAARYRPRQRRALRLAQRSCRSRGCTSR